MIIGIAVAVGAVLLCTCGYVVLRKRKQARG
ncbi:LPXTG cell wall anchor domain-containing protein [Streptomyces sp. NPDC090127]